MDRVTCCVRRNAMDRSAVLFATSHAGQNGRYSKEIDFHLDTICINITCFRGGNPEIPLIVDYYTWIDYKVRTKSGSYLTFVHMTVGDFTK